MSLLASCARNIDYSTIRLTFSISQFLVFIFHDLDPKSTSKMYKNNTMDRASFHNIIHVFLRSPLAATRIIIRKSHRGSYCLQQQRVLWRSTDKKKRTRIRAIYCYYYYYLFHSVSRSMMQLCFSIIIIKAQKVLNANYIVFKTTNKTYIFD